MELLGYIRLLYRWSWLLLLGGIVAVLASYVVFRTTTPWPPYKATATILVGEDDNQGPEVTGALVSTYAELATRRPITQQVIENLELNISTQDLEKAIDVSRLGVTRLMEISVTYDNPLTAVLIANEIAQQLGEVTLTTTPTPVQVVSEAKIPTRPGLTPYIGMIIAGIMGVVVASGLPILLEYFNSKVRTSYDVEQKLELTILGHVQHPARRRRNKLHQGFKRIVGQKNDHLNAFHWICFHIESLAKQSTEKLLITGVDAIPGMNLLTSQLAQAWAEDSNKVVLVNAQSTPPVVSQWFGFPENGRFSANQSTTENDNIVLPEEQKIVVSQNMLDDLSQQANHIIIDGPPTLSSANAARLAGKADGVVLVLEVDKTTLAAAQTAKESLHKAGGQVLGAILLS